MIEKRSIVDQIEITRSGAVQVRFALLLVEDDKEIDSKWHRTVVNPGIDVDLQMGAVNRDLASARINMPAITSKQTEQLKAVCKLVHTPEVVAAYRARMEDAMKAAANG